LSALLEARGLVKRYGSRDVVADVDLSLGAGEVLGLLGPNGAGKTTVFGMLAGLIRPDRGTVRLGDIVLDGLPVHRRARAGLGYLAQEPSAFRGMTVRDNLWAALEIRGVGRRACAERAEQVLVDLGLTAVADQRAADLSGGERRRTEIARTLCGQPRVMILDEPFAAIDPQGCEELSSLLRSVRDTGIGLLLTDHRARQLLPLCDELAVLIDGRIVARGGAEKVIADPVVRERYLGVGFEP
jgi:lipopolysaccharide export system ATP-binding protein